MKTAKSTKKEKLHIPIFLASDDNYLPYLAVALRSISDNSTPSYVYDIKILSSSGNIEGMNIR